MQYALVLSSLIEYYANLLIVQYHDLPKAKATIKLITSLMWSNLILHQIRDGFDWKTAEGKQLDIVGAWVGCDRFYDGQLYDFNSWFSLIDWDSTPDTLQGGFSDFSDFETLSGGILDYNDFSVHQNQLTDAGFRIMIGLKIIKNSISHTAKVIDDAIYEYFSGDVYTEWVQNTLTYYYPANLSGIMRIAAYKNILPVPTGTKLELREI